MGLVLDEEQTILKDSAKAFFADQAPVTAFRKLRDEKDETGFSRELWRAMAEMGWAGIVIPEAYGGLEYGFQGLALVLEEQGRTLAASPLVSTVLLGAGTLMEAGSEAQKSALLPKIAEGSLLLTVAIDEGHHFNPAQTAFEAKSDSDGFILTGEKTFVLDGHVADKIIVLARTSGNKGDREGLTLFLVEGTAEGLTRERLKMLDSRNAALLMFDQVKVTGDAVIGAIGGGYDALESVLDRAAIGLAAEMLGSASAVFEMTLDYLKERRQFGQLIGSFQSLQHRAADMFTQLELSKSIVMTAATALDESSNEISSLASLAKAFVGETSNKVTREGIQMHGGIGMTDEHDVGLYLKRSRVAEHTFGSAAYHRDRYARLNDY
ncbi:MAG: acyl-CoA dehydrogenase [Alphaproteobacteria bacterium]|nr:MAG: acyl-CoA dehydrogenase [Alphaproteobacteria bacterium]